MDMRVLVCGGRNFDDAERVAIALNGITPTEVAQGGASGADYLALAWCRRHGIPCRTYTADWESDGRAAGPLRNQAMLEDFRPDMVLAFPGGNGTRDMVRKARKAGVKVCEFHT